VKFPSYIFRTRWFWVLFVLCTPLAWFLSGYIPHKYRMWQVENYREMVQGDWGRMQQDLISLAESYKNDSYGGSTPEETLRLFIEALEAKDYDLASKYFVVENQPKELSNMSRGVSSGGISSLIAAYRDGSVKSTPYQSGDKYELEVYPVGKDIPFGFILTPNPFTEKWKILE
jgi:hypothetical protein